MLPCSTMMMPCLHLAPSRAAPPGRRMKHAGAEEPSAEPLTLLGPGSTAPLCKQSSCSVRDRAGGPSEGNACSSPAGLLVAGGQGTSSAAVALGWLSWPCSACGNGGGVRRSPVPLLADCPSSVAGETLSPLLQDHGRSCRTPLRIGAGRHCQRAAPAGSGARPRCASSSCGRRAWAECCSFCSVWRVARLPQGSGAAAQPGSCIRGPPCSQWQHTAALGSSL